MKDGDCLGSIAFQGKVAMITGAAQGLGKEIALAFARCGAAVVLADIKRPVETQSVIEGIGGICVSEVVNVSDESQVISLTQKVLSKFKKIDILINNAGLSQLSYVPTHELPLEEWERVINVNLTGTFLCCKHIGRSMLEHNQGVIVNVASTAGITGVKRAPAYCASKAGVILLTKSLALEWAGHHIRVNAVAPHYLETPLTEGLREAEQVYQDLTRYIPQKRFGKTSEVAGAVLFLCSDLASYMTGSTLIVDGGYLAQ
ncbi:MAG: hypothetical protein DRH12_12510 [Deltaproteobacteria bacterium]|nr:MAG: hypothetical protein DRH12_12510 [Deltaproteobacteria bacterium]